jgi:hypothetical protein
METTESNSSDVVYTLCFCELLMIASSTCIRSCFLYRPGVDKQAYAQLLQDKRVALEVEEQKMAEAAELLRRELEEGVDNNRSSPPGAIAVALPSPAELEKGVE